MFPSQRDLGATYLFHIGLLAFIRERNERSARKHREVSTTRSAAILDMFNILIHKCKVLLGSRINWWYPLLLFAYSAPQGEIGLSAFESH